MTGIGITTSAVLKAIVSAPSAVPSWGRLADSMVATQPDPLYGELGVLLDDGERVQCHVCGEWYHHLGAHTNAAHGLTADAYRQRFGLMAKTKLGGPAWLAMLRATKSEHIRSSGLKRYDGPLKDHQKARTGDILVALTDMTQERRIVARAARVPDLGVDEIAMSMDLLRVEPMQVDDVHYVYGLLSYSSFPDEVKEYANGANVLHLSPDRIKEYRLAEPSGEVAGAYSEIVAPVRTLQDTLEKKQLALRRTRDLLLPRLVSGEVDISDLDIDVGAAV